MWTFTPIYKPTLWGGHQISLLKGEKLPSAPYPIGESWELSALHGDETTVDAGIDAGLTLRNLIERYGADAIGEKVLAKYGTTFPLLLKFLGTGDNLSVQVHPDDDMALQHGMSNGKNEMWMIIDAQEGASIYNGFLHPADPYDFERLVHTGDLEHVLNQEPVKKGDAFYVPAGRVHAIGKGILLAEIQQTSDTTYRIYDYHRKDKDGKERPLHIHHAREAIRFDDIEGQPLSYSSVMDAASPVLMSPFFNVSSIKATHNIIRNYDCLDSFVVVMALNGDAILRSSQGEITLKQGHTVLVSAIEKKLEIIPQSKLFEALECHM